MPRQQGLSFATLSIIGIICAAAILGPLYYFKRTGMQAHTRNTIGQSEERALSATMDSLSQNEHAPRFGDKLRAYQQRQEELKRQGLGQKIRQEAEQLLRKVRRFSPGNLWRKLKNRFSRGA